MFLLLSIVSKRISQAMLQWCVSNKWNQSISDTMWVVVSSFPMSFILVPFGLWGTCWFVKGRELFFLQKQYISYKYWS